MAAAATAQSKWGMVEPETRIITRILCTYEYMLFKGDLVDLYACSRFCMYMWVCYF